MVAARLFMRRQIARVRVLAADAAGCGEAVLADAVAAASGEADMADAVAAASGETDMADAVAAASEAARAGAIEMMRRRPDSQRAKSRPVGL